MGGKTSTTNEDIVNLEAEQAEQARADEAARQGRIDQGLTAIKQAFEGAPVMGTSGSNFSWNNFDPTGATAGGQVSGLPAGYVYYQAPSTTTAPTAEETATADADRPASSHDAGTASWSPHERGAAYELTDPTVASATDAAAAATSGAWGIMGPDGQIYNPGDVVRATGSYDTGKTTGGFDQQFYDDYKQGILDYYMPQVEEQYGDAKDELTYRLARAGTLKSSMSNEQVADLAEQNDLNRADVQSQADTAAADLSTRVASERSKAESQLYATEDPNIAASQALSAVTNLSLDQPELSPLAEVFKVAAVGGANALNAYKSQSYIDQIRNGSKTTKVVL